MLVIVAAIAACSKQPDASAGTDILAEDRTLAARIESDRNARQLPLPTACGTVSAAAQPTEANQAQAKELTRLARDAEMQGNIREARALLRSASELDGTSQSTAYHLGRTSEALGDRTAAVTAYCRFLSLTPTSAESAEARQRVATLSQKQQPVTRVSAGSVGEKAPTQKLTRVATAQRVTARRQATVEPQGMVGATAERRATATPTERRTRSASAAGSVVDSPAPVEPVDVTGSNAAASGDAVSEAPPVTSTGDTPAPAPTVRRGPSRTQSGILGAATGAIIGAATGRSVKGAVIGAAAGGVLGTVVGGGLRPPVGRGIR